jgi:uncharacterized protein DUF998
VSELALGRGGSLMAVAFVASGVGTLCAGAVLRRTLAGSRTVAAILSVSALGSFVSAVFHVDGETAKTSTHGQIHHGAGVLTFVAVVLVMFLCSRRFRQDQAWRPMAWATRLSAAAAVATFVLIPFAGNAYFGLAQRLLLGTMFTWLLTVVTFARRHLTAPVEREIAVPA